MNQYLNRSVSFADYSRLVERLVREGATTGPNQSEAMVGYTKLNLQRMRRLAKRNSIDEEAAKALRNNKRSMIWLTITEVWCGDAAQNIPMIEKLAAESGLVETRYILRDENKELMECFLSNGSRSIPKLIALDAATFEILGTWGPRPQPAQDLFIEMRARGVEKTQIMQALQYWYNENQGHSVQKEISDLVLSWRTGHVAALGV